MRKILLETAKKIKRKIQYAGGEYSHSTLKVKRQLIDTAFKYYNINTTIDCGGCWGVHGGYTFHALSHNSIKKSIIIDTHITNTTRKRASSYNNLVLVEGDFGNRNLVQSLDKVDAVIFYDVLLHQVKPDWDEVFDMYAPKTDHFIVYNQMFVGSDKTVRLTDLGMEVYLENTPYRGQEDKIREFFDKLDQKHPEHEKVYGDVHHYWQWGITPPDLINVAWKNNFRADYIYNYGNFGYLPNFENHGFLFSRVNKPLG